MVLTAQRVLAAAGQRGINAFCSLHGSYDWVGEPPAGIPDSTPGERANENVTVKPGGNHVESYLDIIAPDETPTIEILAASGRYLSNVRDRALPWVATIGRCTFRFGLDLGLEQAWATEFRELLTAALRVRVPV